MSKWVVFSVALLFLFTHAPVPPFGGTVRDSAFCKVALAKDMEGLKTEARVFKMNYANASELVDAVKMLLSQRGSAVAYPPTNSIVVIDTPEKLTQIEQLINQLDVRIEEVMIEAQVIETQKGLLKNLGFDWEGGIFRFIGADLATSFSAALNAIERNTKTKTFSKSSVRVQSNKPGEIQLTEKVAAAPVTTVIGAGGGVVVAVSTLERILAGRILKVTPQVHPDGTVTMNIQVSMITPQPSEFFPGAFVDPLARLANTTVRVTDGETIVLGGTTAGEERQEERKVPGVPVTLGEEKAAQERDVVILLTPRIVK